jgi:hypothetical protein
MTEHTYIIDRFEGSEWAVFEDADARTFSIPRHWLPVQAQEGDQIRLEATAQEATAHVLRFEVIATTREERLAQIRERHRALPRGPKGDITL